MAQVGNGMENQCSSLAFVVRSVWMDLDGEIELILWGGQKGRVLVRIKP